jgi:DNA-binding FadR family transcriptional regulator
VDRRVECRRLPMGGSQGSDDGVGKVHPVTTPAGAAPSPAPARGRRASGITRRSGPPAGKLAATVADRIVDDVLAQGWPVGQVLGSEAELLDRYGVSRAVFREAVRLVEHQQVARMRRGPGGGLVVREPTVDSVIDAVVVYLYRLGARLDDVFETRLVLEEIVVDLAPERVEEADIAALRGLIRREAAGDASDPRELHMMLATVTRNPALELFVDILNRVSALYTDLNLVAPRVARESHDAHVRIVDAVLTGDRSTARHRMRRHLEAEHAWLRRRRWSRQLLAPTEVRLTGGGDKRGEAVARQVFRQVVGDGWPVGMFLGSEPELMERHGVSRAVLREAVRLLEHHDIAAMRRGPGGGLFVSEPGLATVSDTVALYLDRRGMDLGSLAELRSGVELATVDRVMDKVDDEVRARLHRALDAERAAPNQDFVQGVPSGFHAAVARLSRNPVLELVALVLMRLARMQQVNPSGRRRRELVDEATRAHERIVEAILSEDRELVRHRMRRHLDALRPYMG